MLEFIDYVGFFIEAKIITLAVSVFAIPQEQLIFIQII